MELLVNAVKITSDCTLEYKANPKRSGCKAWTRYEGYQAATTIDEYMEITTDQDGKYGYADLRYDEAKGFLKVMNADGEQINLKEE